MLHGHFAQSELAQTTLKSPDRVEGNVGIKGPYHGVKGAMP